MAISTVRSSRRFSTRSALRAALQAPTSGALSTGGVDSLGPSLLGLAFWVVAARTYPIDSVGRSAVLIFVLIALAAAARLAPAGGPGSSFAAGAVTGGRLSDVGVRMALAAAGAGIFIGGVAVWAPELRVFRDSSAMLLVVVAGAAFVAGFGWTVTDPWPRSTVLDAPVVHLGVGLLRVALALLLADRSAQYGIVLAWLLPVPLGLLVLAWVGAGHRRTLGEVTGGSPGRHPVFDPWGTIIGWCGLAASVLVVLAQRGPTAGAIFAVGWLLSHSAYRMVLSFADGCMTEPVPDGHLVDRFRLVRILETMVLAVPAVILATAVAPQLLHLFGASYAGATTMLRLLLVGSVPVIATRLVSGRQGVDRRPAAAPALHVGTAVATTVFVALFTGWFGLTGVGVAFVLVAGAVAVAVLLENSVWWWGQRLPDQTAAVVADWIRRWRQLRTLPTRRPLNQEVNQLLSARYQTLPAWSRRSNTARCQSIAVSGHEGRPPIQVELAHTKSGTALLARRVASVSAVNETEGIADLRRLVPYPIEHGEDPTGYLIESAVSGQLGSAEVSSEVVKERVQAVLAAIGELHDATGEHMPLDRDTLDHWVTRPLRYLGDACRLPDSDLVAIGRVLFEGLEGAQVRFARVHGSLRLDNTLFEPGGTRLTGIVGWEWSERGPVLADRGVLTLSALALQQRRDVGMLVYQLLGNPSPFAEHPAFVSDLGDDLSPRALVLLAWLHHLKPELLAATDRGMGDYWTARNVQPVLSRLRLDEGFGGRVGISS